MGPITARMIDELGYDPGELEDPGVLGALGGSDERAAAWQARGANDSCFPKRWQGPNGSGAVRAGAPAAPALASVDPADVPAGAILPARDGARPVAIARLASGRLVVVDDVCPHDGGRISDGFVDGERLVCARHGWELEVEEGRCRRARGPASCGKKANC